MSGLGKRGRKWWLLAAAYCTTAAGGPFVDPGDAALRHDIQSLSDHGVIDGPVTTWPLAWAPILDDLAGADVTSLSPALAGAVLRVRQRGRVETRSAMPKLEAGLGLANDPARIRPFQDTPRGEAEVSARGEWSSERYAAEISVQYVDGDPEGDEYRADGSMIGFAVGNWWLSANTLERWWGPGWDGSLVVSNNARPIPSITLDRIFTGPFDHRWLRWIGPWDLNLTFGQLEGSRFVRDAWFFGMRVNFRPLDALELGLFRTAQWCGDGRPCSVGTFTDLFLGRDNRGDAGIDTSNEPGNQLAGLDVRWAPPWLGGESAVYGQLVGEDEAGGFPSRWLGQAGAERTAYLGDRWSARFFGELSATSCQFYESSEIFDCAYNHSIYRTGYRYRGRAIGHGVDGDARLVSAGLIAVDADGTEWQLLLRYGKLNRGGAPDPRHSLTPTPKRLFSIDLMHARTLPFGSVDAGLGYEEANDLDNGSGSSGMRFYLQWRSGDVR